MIGDALFDAAAIAQRVRELGAEIGRDYAGKTPLLIGVLNAAAPFLADLARAVEIDCEIDVIALNRVGEASGISFEKAPVIPLRGRHVIVVDDTVDTGMTLQYIVKTLLASAPASLQVCTLLDRPQRRIAEVPIAYRAFTVPDVYVVGYGLDYRGRYRELPALYAHATWPA